MSWLANRRSANWAIDTPAAAAVAAYNRTVSGYCLPRCAGGAATGTLMNSAKTAVCCSCCSTAGCGCSSRGRQSRFCSSSVCSRRFRDAAAAAVGIVDFGHIV